MITFCIPTWNRAESLRECVESIAQQGPDAIFISDDASTDGTPQVLAELARKYPFITYKVNEHRLGFTGNYRQAVLGSKTDYTWTFGDDDRLEPTALSYMMQILRTAGCDFYHVSETTRTDRQTALLSDVWSICNTVGWLEFTGFISCNIGRTELMQKGVNSPNWELFGLSAYPQSLAILETMAQSKAMMVELGVVQASKPNKETSDRWVADQIGWKYLYVGDGLRRLVEQGTIQSKVEEVFFRYIEGSLFNRLMQDFITRVVTAPNTLKESDWACLAYMAGMVTGARGGILRNWLSAIRERAESERSTYMAAAVAAEALYKVAGNIMMPIYPLSYLPAEEEKNDVAA